jgi:hypothetical protein
LNTEQTTIATINRWFDDPTGLVPEGDTFVGVLVFERLTPVKRGPMRIGIAIDTYMQRRWERDPTMTMPFSTLPSAAWKGAKVVGLGTTREEALVLLFPDSQRSG